ncbi:MAG: undecaprenyldiphospho-muramoylpentapeptide beta-N-acetylglucosaminyltransferase [Bacteroidales bacterium]|nr:undecaprenyldiphospho-muramoylpentapeptide beta-N-acetylglucosaminyltransferase [Bacteroidales bacterium]
MENTTKSIKVIISGGGTGGHIFPAIAIANALQRRLNQKVEILFIGALGRMEMERVPEAGYRIEGLPIAGFQRSITLSSIKKNLVFPFKLIKSLSKAKHIIRNFQPDVVIGVGGYASGPTLRQATKSGIACLIQEQNSYPGVTNKLVADKVKTICVAYPNMEQFFPKEKIVLTGNPIRQEVIHIEGKREQALSHFNLQPNKKTLLIVGGSQGARTINEAIKSGIDQLIKADIQVLWQTGNFFKEQAQEVAQKYSSIKAVNFIREMDLAYAAADVIVSRAGAIAISELCNIGKPVIFVPLPSAAEDHQTKNAKVLTNDNAGILVNDFQAREMLADKVVELFNNPELMKTMANNIKHFAIQDADEKIADEILKLIQK